MELEDEGPDPLLNYSASRFKRRANYDNSDGSYQDIHLATLISYEGIADARGERSTNWVP